jgi:hypothetical protein
MTPETPDNVEEFDDDINTTAPQAEPVTWTMPAPVFRKTSGRLPKDFEKRSGERGAVQLIPEPEVEGEAVSTPEPKPKSPVLKIIVIALALAAMVAFLVVFLTVVYFMFLRSNGAD